MNSFCGADCQNCYSSQTCRGCKCSDGCPFGKKCFLAACIQADGMEGYLSLRKELIAEINDLHISGMPAVSELYALQGAYVNLEYPTPGGSVKLLDDSAIYLGNQLGSMTAKDRCYGIVADARLLLVCEYGENGFNPEIVLLKRR